MILNVKQSPEEPYLEALDWLKYSIESGPSSAPHYNGVAMHGKLARTTALDIE